VRDTELDRVELFSSRILVVDDQPTNVRLLEALLAKWGFEYVTGLTDPALVAQRVSDQPPDLVMLDLHMPGLSGLDVMRLLEPVTDPSTPVPILVLTADSTVETKRQALAAGASDFLTKPFDSEEVRLRVSNLLRTRRLETQLKRHGDELEERVHERTKALEQAKLEIAERLAMAAEYRDDETHQHAERIGHTAALLAARLGLSATTVTDLRRAAPLHDIGKIAITDTILLKPGRLTAEEFEVIKTHTVIGARILSGSSARLLQLAEEIALSHHERWDGTGYPRELSGEAIPLTGRIVAVADVFDALTHRRPYKEAWPVDKAAEEVIKAAGSHFDPEVVAPFASLDHYRLVAPEHIEGAAPVLPASITGAHRHSHRDRVLQFQRVAAEESGRRQAS
jgi:putative two-component system response regulator